MRTAAEAEDVPLDLESLRATLRERPIRLAILFGSRATGATHESSDVGVAVEFDSHRPSDPAYNDLFLGLSADLSEALGTDDVDLVDLRTVSPSLADSIFERGVLLVGDRDDATDRREELTAAAGEQPSPRERLDAALAKIDAHLDADESGVPAAGESDDG